MVSMLYVQSDIGDLIGFPHVAHLAADLLKASDDLLLQDSVWRGRKREGQSTGPLSAQLVPVVGAKDGGHAKST